MLHIIARIILVLRENIIILYDCTYVVILGYILHVPVTYSCGGTMVQQPASSL